MDWRREGDILEQILALLVSFAGLADRAAGLPLCLQLPALVFLTQGEAVARSFVIGLPAGAPAAIMNAINDAIQPFGKHISDMPFTPERILKALGKV